MMDLLDFARGPALQVALGIFVLGMTWRIVSLILMPRTHEMSAAKPGARPKWIAGIREIIRRLKPDPEFARRVRFPLFIGYTFHIGLLVIVVGSAPHIMFIKDLLGLSWPNLPTNVIFAVGVVTFAALLAQLVYRLGMPVLRIISTFDDYFSWLVTTLPVATGLLATSHLGARYETLLAIHILSVALFLVWMPFGKLMHSIIVFGSRYTTGVTFTRRGAKV